MQFEIKGIDKTIQHLKEYQKRLPDKTDKLLERLATIGAFRARIDFSNAMYAGDNDVEVEVTKDGNGYVIKASGSSVLFIEFGTGILNPEHPQSGEFGFMHGTYGKGKGANPNGWVYVGSQGNAGQTIRDGVYRTYGNPPAMAMWNASKDIRQEIEKIAREVFGGD